MDKSRNVTCDKLWIKYLLESDWILKMATLFTNIGTIIHRRHTLFGGYDGICESL